MISNFKFKISNSEHGYIALISAVIISILLLAITVNLGFSGFFTSFNILDSEFKERSTALAGACVNYAMLNLAKGITSSGTVTVGSEACRIELVQNNNPFAGQATIRAAAVVNQSHSNLKVVVNSANFSTISWEECATFGSCP